MKKLLIIALAAGLAGSAFATYQSPDWEATATPWEAFDSPANWGGTLPSGSTTGLISSVTLATWGGLIQNFALRVEAPIDVNGLGDLALRGGTSGSGITSIYEVEDLANTGFTYVNLHTDQITMWSQFGEKMELSILSGRVEAGNLNLVSGGNGTINLRDGLLHSGTWNGGDVNINMLAGGAGNIVVDDINGTGVGATFFNFESGNLGSISFLDNAGASAGGSFEWAVLNNHVSIDGIVDNNLSSYSITGTGGNDTTIAMIPEPATFGMMALIGGGILFIRKRFMI